MMHNHQGSTRCVRLILILLSAGALYIPGCAESTSEPTTVSGGAMQVTSVERSDRTLTENSTTAIENDTSTPPSTETAAAADAVTASQPAPPQKQPTLPEGKLDLSFDDLEFKIERDQEFDRAMLTEQIEAYAGREVTIRGFINAATVFQQKGIKEFVLVRDNQECCFGPGAYIYHNIQVEMEPGKSTNFSVRPISVTGHFAIKPWIGPDGKCYSVYHLSAESAR
ncbi:MAG: hypothetical protein KDA60_00695 [Planctomycetales bacterium]|nr:hypothetical protein [Planctomycetales bacterium]